MRESKKRTKEKVENTEGKKQTADLKKAKTDLNGNERLPLLLKKKQTNKKH